MLYAIRGFLLGLLLAVLVYFAERTTGQISWPLVLGFPVCWTVAGYLFWKWDVGGFHSERNKRRTMKIVRAVEKDLYRK
jgi:hypothetical protein